ncbi:hypothetical protein NLG97_g403 [Lecanicillium saksenae]|uniref:Uncharacterized protein n=1 Tax=Lecanicillium saksenae TaxID=468837 RepID=A0ACC1R9D3_9HYPO|nr:hypothetical protein NLG97_g403 [Lecanicillium saksenae]
MKSILALSALAAAASAKTALMVPYYISPYGPGMQDWDALVNAIEKYPALDFYIILNDQGGCPWGTNPANPCNPLSPGLRDYAKYLGRINARSNTKLIGYVATGFGARDIAEVKQGVDDYAQWATMLDWDNKNQNISMHGVFFDEINASASQDARNLEMTNYAKSKLSNVVLNPGVSVTTTNESLWNSATAILNLETCYTKDHDKAYDGKPPNIVYRCPLGYPPFTPALLDQLPTDASKVAKSSVVVHDFYETWNPYVPASKSTFETDATAIVKKGVHSFYISQYGYQGNFTMGPASISEVARIAASA